MRCIYAKYPLTTNQLYAIVQARMLIDFFESSVVNDASPRAANKILRSRLKMGKKNSRNSRAHYAIFSFELVVLLCYDTDTAICVYFERRTCSGRRRAPVPLFSYMDRGDDGMHAETRKRERVGFHVMYINMWR